MCVCGGGGGWWAHWTVSSLGWPPATKAMFSSMLLTWEVVFVPYPQTERQPFWAPIADHFLLLAIGDLKLEVFPSKIHSTSSASVPILLSLHSPRDSPNLNFAAGDSVRKNLLSIHFILFYMILWIKLWVAPFVSCFFVDSFFLLLLQPLFGKFSL